MARELPPRPNLNQLKNQAKELLERCRRENDDALKEVVAFLPNPSRLPDGDLARGMALHDAQLVLARSYGFANWAGIKRYVESVHNPLRPMWVVAIMGEDLELIAKLIDQDQTLVDSLHREFEDPYRYKVFPVATLTYAAAGPPQQTVSPRDVHRRINVEMVDLLLDRGADPNVHSHHGRPLSWARDPQVISLLIERGGDVNLWHDNGGSPLNFAVWKHGDVEHMRVLLDAGADPNSANSDGSTALHTAAGDGSTELVRLLLERGARKNAVNAAGQRPIDLARSRSHEEIARLLTT